MTDQSEFQERMLAIAKSSAFNWHDVLKTQCESIGGEVRSDGLHEMTVLVPPYYFDDFRKLAEQIVPVGYRVTVAVPYSEG